MKFKNILGNAVEDLKRRVKCDNTFVVQTQRKSVNGYVHKNKFKVFLKIIILPCYEIAKKKQTLQKLSPPALDMGQKSVYKLTHREQEKCHQ